MTNVKNINSLMRYLRDAHNIEISGSSHKRKLRNIGYYHGYKGYRFITKSNNKISYTNFNEILAVNTFDMKLKALFYPQVMFIETALKNHVLEVVLENGNTDSFNSIFETLLTNYKNHTVGSDPHKAALLKRLKLRDKIYSTLSRDFTNNKQVIQHFYYKDKAVPIWAIFEVINLGEFGTFVSCLDSNIKKEVSNLIGLNQSCDSNGKLTESIIFIIKDLRNAVAHNEAIFDTRFKSSHPNNALIQCISLDTGINNISFKTIVDYLILIIYMLKKFGTTKTEMNKIVSEFEVIADQVRNQIPINIYNKILYTNTRMKVNLIKEFIKS